MIGDCKCCEAYKQQIKHLQSLLDRTMDIIAPKADQPLDQKLGKEKEQDAELITYGDP